MDIHDHSNLLKEWDQFDWQIKSQNDSQNVSTMQSPTTQHPLVTNITVEGTVSNTNRQDVEIIPENPSEEIILKIEDIPPLDVFYSAKHRAVVRK